MSFLPQQPTLHLLALWKWVRKEVSFLVNPWLISLCPGTKVFGICSNSAMPASYGGQGLCHLNDYWCCICCCFNTTARSIEYYRKLWYPFLTAEGNGEDWNTLSDRVTEERTDGELWLVVCLLLFKTYLYWCHAYECSTCIHVCTPHACLMPVEVGRGCQIFWN